jgi:hypothetical protein
MGELGIGSSVKSVSKPCQIKFFNDKNISDFISSMGSSYVLIGLKKKNSN